MLLRRISLLLAFTFALGCRSSDSGVDISGPAESTRGGGNVATSENNDDSQPTEENAKVVGYSVMSLANPFFQIIVDNLSEEAEKNGYTVLVEDANGDVKAQSENIDSFIDRRVAAIVLNPVDRLSIGPAIKKANEAGIPVFTCDLQCVAPEAEIVAHVGTDNYEGGKFAGEAMVEALGDSGGKVFIVHYPSANSCVLRVEGFMEVINAYNKDRETGKIEIVGEQDGGGEPNKGFQVTAAALQANPDLAGLFAINDPSGLGAYTALEQAGKTEQVMIVGFDGHKDGKQAIKEGKFYADPIQFPDKMGKLTMENILKYFKGEEVEAVKLLATKLYKQEDALKDPELQ
jgi:ribose transport system substrate-binding protein